MIEEQNLMNKLSIFPGRIPLVCGETFLFVFNVIICLLHHQIDVQDVTELNKEELKSNTCAGDSYCTLSECDHVHNC